MITALENITSRMSPVLQVDPTWSLTTLYQFILPVSIYNIQYLLLKSMCLELNNINLNF